MKIAVLEDDPAISEMLTTLLELEGHAVSTYAEPASLLARFLNEDPIGTKTYDLLIADILLPSDMLGTEVVQRIWQVEPDLAVIIISGCNSRILQQARAMLNVPVLQKPFHLDELIGLVNRSTLVHAQSNP